QEDAIVDLEIPAPLLTISSNPIQVPSAFKIAAVKAEISGTGIVLDPIDVQKGGKTIVITLKNASFVKNPSTSDMIDNITGSSTEWTKVQTALKNDSKTVTVSGNKVTIKLPAVPSYNSVSGETVTINIPKSLLLNGE